MRSRRSLAKSLGEPRRWRREGASLLFPALLFVFPVLFALSTLPRLFAPFELEWNEGQAAEQALRFATGQPLYPSPESGWVPYMYMPLYHMAWGAIMRLTGIMELWPGRLISLLAAVAAGAAIAATVFDATRRIASALGAAFLFFAFHKAAGYWLDLARVDTLALALLLWGCHFTLRRTLTAPGVATGLLLLAASCLTKQSGLPVATFCAVVTLVRAPRASRLAVALAALATVNALVLLRSGGDSEFLRYTVKNAVMHASTTAPLMPGNISADDFFLSLRPRDAGAATVVVEYARRALLAPPPIWNDFLRHIALLLAAVAGWLALAAARRRRPRGALYLLVLSATSATAVGAYLKYGGYVNNFLPPLAVVAILAGCANGGIASSLVGRAARRIAGAVGLVILVLQLTQPWAQPDPHSPELRWAMLRNEHDPAMYRRLNAYFDHLTRERHRAALLGPNATAAGGAAPFDDPGAVRAHAWRRFLAAGLLWSPSSQIPLRESYEAYDDMMRWLRSEAASGRPVWVMHHQWYGYRSGNPTGYSIDMVRCAAYAGDPVPQALVTQAAAAGPATLVLFTDQLETAWMPPGLAKTLEANYEFAGYLPWFVEHPGSRALLPMTGADVRPYTIFRRRTAAPPTPP